MCNVVLPQMELPIDVLRYVYQMDELHDFDRSNQRNFRLVCKAWRYGAGQSCPDFGMYLCHRQLQRLKDPALNFT